MGEPDEFDYVAQLDALSLNDHVQYMRTPDPVFLQVKLCSQELRETWKDFLGDPKELRTETRNSQ